MFVKVALFANMDVSSTFVEIVAVVQFVNMTALEVIVLTVMEVGSVNTIDFEVDAKNVISQVIYQDWLERLFIKLYKKTSYIVLMNILVVI